MHVVRRVGAGLLETAEGSRKLPSVGGLLVGLKIDSDVTSGDWGYGIYVAAGDRAWYSANTLAGAAALNNMEIATTDATTASTGYSRSIYVSHTNTGTKTGTAEVNAIASDIDASGNVLSAYAFTAYCGACSGATINRVAGYACTITLFLYRDMLSGKLQHQNRYI